ALVWSLLFIAYCLTYAIEYGVPFFKRMTSVAMMVYLFMGTFGLSEANLVDQGTYVILAGFTLSFVKAGLERFIPSLLSYGLSGVHWIISRAEGSRERTSDIPRTLTGQALSGATAATLVAGSALAAGWVTELPAIVIGASAGYAFSLLTLFINVLFEHPSPDIDEQVPKTIFQLMMKILATLLTGGLLAFLVVYAGEAGLAIENPESDAYEFQKSLGSRWTIRGSIGLGVLAIAVQFIVFRLVLVENLPPSLKDTIDPVYDWRDSPTWLVLRTSQFFPNLTAIPTCTLVTVFFREDFGALLSLNPFLLQMLMTGSGILLANISALTVHRLMESPPQLDPSPQS
ncbi:unnamed protein product, partial [Durusdinium trenchii]